MGWGTLQQEPAGPHFKGTADQKQDHKPRRAQGNGKEGQGIGVVFHGIQKLQGAVKRKVLTNRDTVCHRLMDPCGEEIPH